MMRGVLSATILTHKTGSNERDQGWQKIAERLNAIEGFQVTSRGVRDKI